MSDTTSKIKQLGREYAERVYAGVLGKMIGVYLGRPFEQWTHQRIMQELGEIWYYVNEKLGKPLIVTDDDLTGTFTFLRALEDYDYRRDLASAQIGQGWLNYIIEGKTILWWGGLGYSTEHTAYLRLKRGTTAPASGSTELNGKILSEQIGAQIFIDGWALVAPGDPTLAADLAGRAGHVSHDGESVYAAQLWAAMEAAAFVESDVQRLLDIGLSYIPSDSIISRMIAELRRMRTTESDWYKARAWLEANYGYDKYGGACHVVPNHALMIMSLLYGDDDFQKTLMIINTSGCDTDCNSGNVGCLLGIKNGLAAIDASSVDWRTPLADRLYLPTADGGRAITDAARETFHIVDAARALAGLPAWQPKDGAQFHFELPGSVQGFHIEKAETSTATATLENVPWEHSDGERGLAIHLDHLSAADSLRLATPTFIPPDAINMSGSYSLLASPTLYSGETVRARVQFDPVYGTTIACRLFISVYDAQDHLQRLYADITTLQLNTAAELSWRIPDTNGQPIAEVGIEIVGTDQAAGTLYLDWLGWDNKPQVTLKRGAGKLWQRAWVEGIFRLRATADAPFHITQNEGVGLLIHGSREWQDYQVSAPITPHLGKSAGIAARVQGMRRYYALILRENGTAALIRELDGTTTLAEVPFAWQFDTSYHLKLSAQGDHIRGAINDHWLFDLRDESNALRSGGIALVLDEGCLSAGDVHIEALESNR